jgi:hypothetical protein
MIRTLLLPAFALVLAACEPVTVLPVGPDGGLGTTPDACGAQGLQSLVGEPETAVTAMLLTRPYRIISPGEAVTMDFWSDRINFELDGEGRIVRIYCG